MSTKTDVLPELDDEVTEPDGKAHYVRAKKLLLAGTPVTALCGKRYIPTVIGGALDKEICNSCAELYALLGAWD